MTCLYILSKVLFYQRKSSFFSIIEASPSQETLFSRFFKPTDFRKNMRREENFGTCIHVQNVARVSCQIMTFVRLYGCYNLPTKSTNLAASSSSAGWLVVRPVRPSVRPSVRRIVHSISTKVETTDRRIG